MNGRITKKLKRIAKRDGLDINLVKQAYKQGLIKIKKTVRTV